MIAHKLFHEFVLGVAELYGPEMVMLYNGNSNSEKDYLLFWEFLTDLNNVILRAISIM
ncbi:hypothetical protein RO3G_11472 [Rhizopus delemar RA 99-880]|uniref:Uncharacterized protein n=1 Tax=Rhizopus delemar (strain RA 99-880 / ATCC MYA-4621 / FGSC 9543 / NRRL 43880) TaxID=246409 RepID=I1CE81_RHIO9|nr:hypothetical protein RO3G_11472 [Rhizopus delemar RA 99-880]|eukprot:EIE86761.1 hypothetical protein RO3G_11472 [Rhizopus delemar RA 99-880]